MTTTAFLWQIWFHKLVRRPRWDFTKVYWGSSVQTLSLLVDEKAHIQYHEFTGTLSLLETGPHRDRCRVTFLAINLYSSIIMTEQPRRTVCVFKTGTL